MRLTALLFLLATPVFAADETITQGNTLATAPIEWLGETPHFVAMGQIGGRAVDIQYLDIASAEGVAEFAGKREYLPVEGGTWRYGDFEVALKAVIGGVEKSLEMEFENHDFTEHALPANFFLQGEEFPKGLLSNLEAALEWETPESTVNDEIAGWTGTLTLTTDTGTKDDKGLVPDGMIGGFVTATRDADMLILSFTVPVVEYELDD